MALIKLKFLKKLTLKKVGKALGSVAKTVAGATPVGAVGKAVVNVAKAAVDVGEGKRAVQATSPYLIPTSAGGSPPPDKASTSSAMGGSNVTMLLVAGLALVFLLKGRD